MRVSVVGQVVIDRVLRLRGERASYRWDVEGETTLLGGAGANIAMLYALLGGAPTLFPVRDAARDDIFAQLEAAGIALHPIASGSLATNYSIFFAGEPRATMALSPVTLAPGERVAVEDILREAAPADVLHLAPTAPGVVEEMSARLMADRAAGKRLPLLVLSPATEFFEQGVEAFARLSEPYDLLCMDLAEARAYTGAREHDAVFAAFARRPGQCVVITDGANGAHAIYHGRHFFRPAERSGEPVVDTLGCGDVFAATFAYALASARRAGQAEATYGNETISGALTFATRAARLMATIPGMWTGMLAAREQFAALIGLSLRDADGVSVSAMS